MNWIKKIIQQKIEKKQVRTFGIVLSLLCLLPALIQFLKTGTSFSYYWVIAALAIFFCSVFFQKLLLPFYRGALILAFILGWINTRLLLGLIFYFIFTPLALLFKMLGKDPLQRKFDHTAPSYWVKRKIPPADKDRYYQQF